ncbi:MAG TPA: hypothetical protein VH684_11545 [Xanthobacteraceae bacterium]|jgi:hypothetical protein
MPESLKTPETPKYLLTADFWSAPPHGHGAHPILLPRGSLIEHSGPPNRNMVPVNDAARERVTAAGL